MKLPLLCLLLWLAAPAFAQKPLYEKKLYELPLLPDRDLWVAAVDEKSFRLNLSHDSCLVSTDEGKVVWVKPGKNCNGYWLFTDVSGNLYYTHALISRPLFIVPAQYAVANDEKILCRLPDSENHQFAVVPVIMGDSLYVAVNGKVIHKLSISPVTFNSKQFDKADWCKVSNNGNCIYFINHNSQYYLYVNGKLITSSKEEFTGMQINNEGVFSYATHRTTGKFSEQVVHTSDTVLGPVGYIHKAGIRGHGGYFYTGFGKQFIVINNRLFSGIYGISDILIPDRRNFLFLFRKEEYDEEEGGKNKNIKPYLNVKGKVYDFDYEQIIAPSIDSLGNFAFFGLRDYYLYPVINGKEGKALSKYGVRAVPIFIRPDGTLFCYYPTDTQIYMHRNDTLLLPPFSRKQDMRIETSAGRDDAYGNKSYAETNWLVSLVLPDRRWMFHDQQVFSFELPVEPEREKSSQAIAKLYTESQYAQLYEIDKQRVRLIANDKVYEELKDIDEVFEHTLTCTDRGVSFLARKGKTIFKYSTYED